MSITQILDNYKIKVRPPSSDGPPSPSILKPSKPLAGPLPSPNPTRSPTRLSSSSPSRQPSQDSSSSNSSDGHTLPEIEFDPPLNLDLAGHATGLETGHDDGAMQVHRGSTTSTESSITFTEPQPNVGRKLSTGSYSVEGRLRPPTPSPKLGGEGFAGSASSMGESPSCQEGQGTLHRGQNSGSNGASAKIPTYMDKPSIVVHDEDTATVLHDETRASPPNRARSPAYDTRSADVEVGTAPSPTARHSVSISSFRSSLSKSTLCIPEIPEDDLGEVGSPRIGLKGIDNLKCGALKFDTDVPSDAVSVTMSPDHTQDSSNCDWKSKSKRQKKERKPSRRLITGTALVILMQITAGLALFTQGYDQGVMSHILSNPDFKFLMLICSAPQTKRDALASAGLIAVYFAGSLGGGFAGGWMGDKTGRIKVVWLGCFLGILGGVLQTCARGYLWMTLGRVVSGWGTGSINAVIPAWGVEVARGSKRGRNVATAFFFNFLGLCVAFWVCFILQYATESGQRFQWRFALGFQLVFLVLLLLLLPLMPESPHWLAKAGREEAAKDVFAAIGFSDDDEVTKMIKQAKEAGESKGTVRHSDSDKSFLRIHDTRGSRVRRYCLVISLQFWTRLSGLTLVTYLAPGLYRLAGFKDFKSDWLHGINLIIYAVSCLASAAVLDRVGRRISLMCGSAMMALSLALCAAAAKSLATSNDIYQLRWTVILTMGTFLFAIAFGGSWMSIPWLYAAEAFPLETRGRGGSVSVATWALTKGAITLGLTFLYRKAGPWTFGIFAIANVLAIPFVFFFIPETNHRTLQDVHHVFEHGGHFVHRHHAHGSQSRQRPARDAEDIETGGTVAEEAVQDMGPASGTTAPGMSGNVSEFSIPMESRTMSAYARHKKARLPPRD